jgi:hypothetical protein
MERGWYDHGFALVDLGAATIDYYQFPSAAGSTRSLASLYREPLT